MQRSFGIATSSCCRLHYSMRMVLGVGKTHSRPSKPLCVVRAISLTPTGVSGLAWGFILVLMDPDQNKGVLFRGLIEFGLEITRVINSLNILFVFQQALIKVPVLGYFFRWPIWNYWRTPSHMIASSLQWKSKARFPLQMAGWIFHGVSRNGLVEITLGKNLLQFALDGHSWTDSQIDQLRQQSTLQPKKITNKFYAIHNVFSPSHPSPDPLHYNINIYFHPLTISSTMLHYY